MPPCPLLLRTASASSSSSAPSLLLRRQIASSVPRAVRQPDEWSYPSKTGDNRPRRPFVNPDISETIPNEVARRAGVPPYRLPSANLDPFELPPKLPIKHDILTHSITFSAWDYESLRPYVAMARHAALALLIPVTGPVTLANDLQRWSSNKSAFVHAKSKEVFERRTYSQRIDVWDADDKAAEVLVKVLLATGRGQYVKLKVEKFSRDSLDMTPQAPVKPLFHKTERQRSIVHEIAAKFVEDSRAELAREAEDAQRAQDGPLVETSEDWKSAPVDDLVVRAKEEVPAQETEGQAPAAEPAVQEVEKKE